jgi:hypothetical protein
LAARPAAARALVSPVRRTRRRQIDIARQKSSPDFRREQTPSRLAGTMAGMANLVITDDTVTVQMSLPEEAATELS